MTKLNVKVHLCPIFVERNVLSENVHNFDSNKFANLCIQQQITKSSPECINTDRPKITTESNTTLLSDPNAAIKFTKN
jgi:hypothetical protein